MSQPSVNNLFDRIPETVPEEIIEILLKAPSFHLERIISKGQATSPGQWYDQETHEWVVLLSGSAGLWFEGETQIRVLRPGDYLLIPAHLRHRVEWTDPEHITVWLALYFRDRQLEP
ncbi:MAG: cupin domain-containing protein [Deltaproteobacteria bacterium]|nr:cupin domain-containing protein [Deltaproteobacteria bacterium]